MALKCFSVSFPCNCVPFHRRVKTLLGSLASPTLQPVEPEEPFETFEPVRESFEEPASAASSCSSSSNISSNSSSKIITSKVKGSQIQNASSLAPSPARSSALLSSLSSPGRVGTSIGDVGAMRKLNESVGASGDKKENVKTLGTPHKGVGSAGVGTLAGLRGSPLGGFRGRVGGRGIGGRPSPAGRLSFVDRNWLERCQVFGEMETEVRPGAGNQEIDIEKSVVSEKGGKETEGKIKRDERVGKEEIHAEGEGREADSQRDEGFKSITGEKILSDSTPKPALQHTGKSRGGGKEKVKKKGGEEMERGLTPPLPPEDDDETSHKSKGTKKRGRKRQREGEDMEGETAEEGGVKKRRRNGKKKEESSDVNPSPAQEGGKKRRAKKKGAEDGEAEEEKETKVPKKVSQSSVFISAYCMFYSLCKLVKYSYCSCQGSSGELVRRNRGGIWRQENVSHSACQSQVRPYMSLDCKMVLKHLYL